MSGPVPTLDDIAGCYSDLYKSAYGFRPSLGEFREMSEAERVAEFLRVQAASEAAAEEEAEGEAHAQVAFEARVSATIAIGAKDRATAIRWIMDAIGADDADHAEYLLNLRYGYLRSAS